LLLIIVRAYKHSSNAPVASEETRMTMTSPFAG
jgi:hypothetical protein